MPQTLLRVVHSAGPARSEHLSDFAPDLLEGLRQRQPRAERLLVERYAGAVERILVRILGSTADLEDLAQEVFVRVFDRVTVIRDTQALGGFIASITVFVAREAIRARRRRRWLSLVLPGEAPEIELPGVDPIAREAVRAFYDVVTKLPDEERIAFCLRYVEGMDLGEVALACGTSLSTLKRRLRDAERRFAKLAALRPELVDHLKEGTRWPGHAT